MRCSLDSSGRRDLLEQLVDQRFELPAFDTLNRAARHVRAAYTRALYGRVFDGLTPDDLARIDALFIADLTTLRTPWNELKADAGNPTLSHLRDLVARQQWLAARAVGSAALADIPAVKGPALCRGSQGRGCRSDASARARKRATLAVLCWQLKRRALWTIWARCSFAACSTSTMPPDRHSSVTGLRSRAHRWTGHDAAPVDPGESGGRVHRSAFRPWTR